MKYSVLLAALMASVVMMGCSDQTTEEKIQTQISEKVHALTADERTMVQTNAKQFFEKEFPVQTQDGALSKERGVFLECRPSDSNFNGLATCKGMVPQFNGGFKEVGRYCGYTPKLVGCSDEDTVK